MKVNVFSLISMFVLTVILVACSGASSNPDDLVGTWTQDVPSTHITLNADGTGEVYGLAHQATLFEIEWEYLEDSRFKMIWTPVHVSQGDQVSEFVWGFRIEGDELIYTIEDDRVPGVVVEQSWYRVVE